MIRCDAAIVAVMRRYAISGADVIHAIARQSERAAFV